MRRCTPGRRSCSARAVVRAMSRAFRPRCSSARLRAGPNRNIDHAAAASVALATMPASRSHASTRAKAASNSPAWWRVPINAASRIAVWVATVCRCTPQRCARLMAASCVWVNDRPAQSQVQHVTGQQRLRVRHDAGHRVFPLRVRIAAGTAPRTARAGNVARRVGDDKQRTRNRQQRSSWRRMRPACAVASSPVSVASDGTP